jgi:ParB/RepB/Spo0J family partition protein
MTALSRATNAVRDQEDPPMSDAAPIRPFDRIMEIVRERGLSERKACEAAGLNLSTLASARRQGGNMNLSTISAFSQGLAVPLAQLLGEETQQPASRAVASLQVLHPSPLNPRKHFDEDAIADLAASIRTDGILLPLLVRHANRPGNRPIDGIGDGHLEIIAGERRYRAAQLLVMQGHFATDAKAPIRLIDPCSDRKLRELALTENVARKDMTPLEEAEAFAGLVEEGAAPSEIADVVGLTTRTVQKRLRLVKDLTPQVRAALEEGKISVETANVLAACCPKRSQGETLEKLGNGWWRTTAQLKSALLGSAIPESVAEFKVDQYKGDWTVDEDSGLRYFSDGAQFRRLQVAAAKDKVAALGSRFAWAKLWDFAVDGMFSRYSSGFSHLPDHELAGAIVYVDETGKIEVFKGFARDADVRAASRVAEGKPAIPPAPPVTKGHCAHAARRKTEAMQIAVAQSPAMAIRLACLGLLGGDGRAVKIKAVAVEHDDQVIAEPVQATIRRLLDGIHKDGIKFGADGVTLGSHWSIDFAAMWQFLTKLSAAEATELFAALVALRCGTFSGYDPGLGDESAALAIAGSLDLIGREAEIGLTIRPDDLEGLRKDTLIAVCKSAEVGGELTDMRVGELKPYIVRMVDPDYVVPSLRFGPADALEIMLRGKPHPTEVAEAFGHVAQPHDEDDHAWESE